MKLRHFATALGRNIWKVSPASIDARSTGRITVAIMYDSAYLSDAASAAGSAVARRDPRAPAKLTPQTCWRMGLHSLKRHPRIFSQARSARASSAHQVVAHAAQPRTNPHPLVGPALCYCAFTFWKNTSGSVWVWPEMGSRVLIGSVIRFRMSPHAA